MAARARTCARRRAPAREDEHDARALSRTHARLVLARVASERSASARRVPNSRVGLIPRSNAPSGSVSLPFCRVTARCAGERRARGRARIAGRRRRVARSRDARRLAAGVARAWRRSRDARPLVRVRERSGEGIAFDVSSRRRINPDAMTAGV